MKKFTLFLMTALLMTVTSMAQNPAQRELSPSRVAAVTPFAPSKGASLPVSAATKQKQIDPVRLRSAREVLQKGKTANAAGEALRVAKKVITGNEELITEQPAGRQQIYTRSGDAYYVYIFYVLNASYTGAVGNVVFGENNEVYVKNIFSASTEKS